MLDSSNYGVWKAKIKYFISILDEEAWGYVKKKWVHPMKGTGDEAVLKPRDEWTDDEKKSLSLNSKALYALFYGVIL